MDIDIEVESIGKHIQRRWMGNMDLYWKEMKTVELWFQKNVLCV